MPKPDREPTDAEAKAAVFDHTNAWPYEDGDPTPTFMGVGQPRAANASLLTPEQIARSAADLIDDDNPILAAASDERRPPLGKLEATIIVAFAVVVILGVAYVFS